MLEREWLERDMQFRARLDCRLKELRSFLAEADCEHDSLVAIQSAFNAFALFADTETLNLVMNDELLLKDALGQPRPS